MRAPDDTPTHELPLPDPTARLLALAKAIRAHREATANRAVPRRPRDHELYRKLDEASGSNGSARFQLRGH